MVIFASEPLWAALIAWITLGEVMGPSAILGGGCIVSACLVSALADSPAAQKATKALQTRVEVWRQGLAGAALGLISPAAVQAIDELGEMADELTY